MNDLVVKNIDLFGDSVMAARDKDGNIWAGIRWFCYGLGMSEGQMKRQIKNIKEDTILGKGGSKFVLPTGNGEQEVFCLKIDFLPLWLTRISITPNMRKEHPELAEKLLDYQLKAKDILADAFLPRRQSEAEIMNPSEISLGELASYLKIMDKVAVRQNLAPHKIAENFKKVSAQFGVELTEDFVSEPEYEQMTLESLGK